MKNNKALLLSLIKDDLINTKFRSGFEKPGLNTELNALGLSDTVFVLLGINNDDRGATLFANYNELRQKVEAIDLTRPYDALDCLALEIYNELVERKRMIGVGL